MVTEKGQATTYSGGRQGFTAMPGQASAWSGFLRSRRTSGVQYIAPPSQAGDEDGNAATDGGACAS